LKNQQGLENRWQVTLFDICRHTAQLLDVCSCHREKFSAGSQAKYLPGKFASSREREANMWQKNMFLWLSSKKYVFLVKKIHKGGGDVRVEV